MGLPRSSVISKLSTAISAIGVVFFAAGCFSSYWLVKEFTMPNRANVDSHLGLITGCRKVTLQGRVIKDDCSGDGARDWQKIAGGLACTGASLGVLGLFLHILNITLPLVAGKRPTRIALPVFSILSAGFVTSALAIYVRNKKVDVAPRFYVDYDLGWAFVLAAVGTGVHYILTLMGLVDLQRESKRDAAHQISLKEPTVAYAGETNRGYKN